MNIELQKAKDRPEYLISLAYQRATKKMLDKGIKEDALIKLRGGLEVLEAYLSLQSELNIKK